MTSQILELAVDHLKHGGVIAYPTEAVYGLGCDPFNEVAVRRVYQLKGRPLAKGMILIAASWENINPLIQQLTEQQLQRIQASWPGPITWVFPASNEVPRWLRGKDNTIALRLTSHPLAKALCELFGKPIVSTSANPSGFAPAKTEIEVKHYFSERVDYILPGAVGNLAGPTAIRDAISGHYYRQ